MRRRLGETAVLAICLSLLEQLPLGAGQGRLERPLARSSVWRAGLDTPKNYDDHMLECGGLWYKKKRNNQCGLCGDPVDGPRDNENGGKFSNGIITESYAPGQRSQFQVLMNSNHGGYMEFKVCPEQQISQDCFDQHPVPMADRSGYRFSLPEGQQGVFSVDVIIPSVTCQRCVMQWTYTGSKAWGSDDTGAECEGCGPQYELRNCADVSVTRGQSGLAVPLAIQNYNSALENSGSNSPRSQSPFSPDPVLNSNPDPWTNRRRPTPTRNQSPPRRQNNPDPWTNQRTPTRNQSPPRRQNNPDPWINQRTPTRNQSPPRRQNNPDPWTNRRTPTRNQSPQGRQNNADPWTNPRTPNGNQSPPGRLNNPNSWNNRRTPGRNQSPFRRPTNPDPWTNSRRPTGNQNPPRNNLIPYARPENDNPRVNSRPQRENVNPSDPWTSGPSTPTAIENIRILAERLSCVSIGSKAGMEGLDEWCTENCNLDYCPQQFCSCW